MKAQQYINTNSKYFIKQYHSGYECSWCEIENSDLISMLADACTAQETICNQEVYVFSDGSYITRAEDQYFTGSDVLDFNVTQELISNKG